MEIDKHKNTNLLPDFIINQLEEHEKIMGNPSINRDVCVKKIIEYREKGILTPQQEQRIANIDYFDNGDIF